MIIHGCNARGVMNAGVAKAIRERWPETYYVYQHVYKYRGLRLGEVLWSHSYNGEKLIGNCISQDDYGRTGVHVDYDAIRNCMKEVKIECERRSINEFAMPMMGAGLGGGDWNIIEDIVYEETHPLIAKVYYL
nr:macro domain-containing protein [Methanohalobium sp.]